MNYQPVIGLEVHVELATKSKMFCGCCADHFGKEPNTQTCPVCLGLPGALPVPNKKAVEWTIMLGLALNCKINKDSYFERKNYFYPDLPKGYQISQYEKPLCHDGKIEIKCHSGQARMTKKVHIRRVHLEEDTGKLIHANIDKKSLTLVDFNRSGVALVEIVSEPDFRNSEEADIYLKQLQKIIRYLGISDADMEKGTMRIEPSISIKVQSAGSKVQKIPDYRVEIKNINSFKFARHAIDYEIKRQIGLHQDGQNLEQETRGWNEIKDQTVLLRRKEEAHDYRYFPEPDIPPISWTQFQISNFKLHIPELPSAKSLRFSKNYALTDYEANLLTKDQVTAQYFEDACQIAKRISLPIRPLALYIINKKADIKALSPNDLVNQIVASSKVAKLSTEEIDELISQSFASFPQAVKDYRAGKKQALGFLLGSIAKKAPRIEKTVLLQTLEKRLNKLKSNHE